jgi:hypothetical protein
MRWSLSCRVVAATLLVTAGCQDGKFTLNWTGKPPATAPAPAVEPDWPGASSQTRVQNQPETSGPQRPTLILQISFDVVRARVPRGFFSQSEKIWNHLNEGAIASDAAVLLQRNGMRVARGDANSWPPIKALLEQQGQVETSQNRMVLNNGLPLVVEPDPRTRDQTVFLFRPDGSLGGASFPQSTNGLLIEYALTGANLDRIRVSVIPQIRLPRQAPRLNPDTPGFIEQPLLPPTRVLRELAFATEVGPEQFVAIGPSRLIENAHLMGSLLLCEESEGRRLESMYFITPRVLNTTQKSGS